MSLLHGRVNGVAWIDFDAWLEGELHQRGIFLIFLLYLQPLQFPLHLLMFAHDIAK